MVMFKVKTQFQIQFVQSNLSFLSQKQASNRQQQQRAAKLQQLKKKIRTRASNKLSLISHKNRNDSSFYQKKKQTRLKIQNRVFSIKNSKFAFIINYFLFQIKKDLSMLIFSMAKKRSHKIG